MIIIDKNKNDWMIYPIGSPKDALNNRREPEFIGALKFSENENEYIITKYIVHTENEDKLKPPAEAVDLLRSQAVFISSHDKIMEKILKSLNVKVRHTKICPHCIYEGYITILNNESSYNYHGQKICKECAEEIIKAELKVKRYDKKSFSNFKRILDKTDDLDTVLEMLSPRFDPLKHQDLTLFDKVEVKNYKIPEIPISRLKIPKNFKKILTLNGDFNLLPVQLLAIKNGLLKGEDMLVVSATGSGKTLIGELAGVPIALKGRKFLFLTPLIALANQKYRDFKKKYGKLGLKVAIKVGGNRINDKNPANIKDDNIEDADIIVGTYEGLDYILRSGNHDFLDNLGMVLIDEIHTIADEDRGLRLNGLVNRLKNLYPKAQLIGLSATIGNPKTLANSFNMKLVQYSQRPVPLDRHIIYVNSDRDRKRLMKRLVTKEYNTKSSKGYKGQTIIFTNSRRKTHKIANFLSGKGIQVAAYHAGLSYSKKVRIEKEFSKNKLAAVVTTAALAAGVDFPASQVIFESLIMGNDWITTNEFNQMLGRGGRPSFHDRGLIYLLPEIDNVFNNTSEEAKALELLESDVEDVNVDYTVSGVLEEILADVCSGSLKTYEDVIKFYKHKPIPIDTKFAINELINSGIIHYKDGDLTASRFGRAISKSFLSTENGRYVRNSLKRKDYLVKHVNKPFINKHLRFEKDKKKTKNKPYINIDKINREMKIKNIAIDLEPFENAYLNPTIHKQISTGLKMNLSTRLFNESVLETINDGETLTKIDNKFKEQLIKLQIDFLRCECEEKPLCDCLQRGISLFIIDLRLEHNDPYTISEELFKTYGIQAYPGDIYTWLNNLIQNLDAIKRIARSIKDVNDQAVTHKLTRRIENG